MFFLRAPECQKQVFQQAEVGYGGDDLGLLKPWRGLEKRPEEAQGGVGAVIIFG